MLAAPISRVLMNKNVLSASKRKDEHYGCVINVSLKVLRAIIVVVVILLWVYRP